MISSLSSASARILRRSATTKDYPTKNLQSSTILSPENLGARRPSSSSSSTSSSYAVVVHAAAYSDAVKFSSHGDALRKSYDVDLSIRRRPGEKTLGIGKTEVHRYKAFASGAPAYGYSYDDGKEERTYLGGRGMASAGLNFSEDYDDVDSYYGTEGEFQDKDDEDSEEEEMKLGDVTRTDSLSVGIVDSFAVIAFATLKEEEPIPIDASKDEKQQKKKGLEFAPTQQYKVSPNDIVVSHKLRPVDKWSVGSVHTLTGKNLLLIGTPQKTYIGMPHLGTENGSDGDDESENITDGGIASDPKFGVVVRVEEITRDAKVIAFKRRRRKHSKRKKGFRREVTILRVLQIISPDSGSSEVASV